MTTITLSGNLRRFADFQREVEVNGESVERALAELVARYPDLSKVLLDGDGAVRRVHRLGLNDEILAPTEIHRPLTERDQVFILTAVAGG